MSKGILVAVAVISIACGAIFAQKGPLSHTSPRVEEHWINVNHIQVRLDKTWHDVYMVPLSDNLCKSGHPLFKRYCE